MKRLTQFSLETRVESELRGTHRMPLIESRELRRMESIRGAANVHIPVTRPVVINTTKTQPGTSPRSSLRARNTWIDRFRILSEASIISRFSFNLSVFILSVFILSVFILSVFILSVFILSVFILSVFILSVFILGVFILGVFILIFILILIFFFIFLSLMRAVDRGCAG